jgi:hypothetical protein
MKKISVFSCTALALVSLLAIAPLAPAQAQWEQSLGRLAEVLSKLGEGERGISALGALGRLSATAHQHERLPPDTTEDGITIHYVTAHRWVLSGTTSDGVTITGSFTTDESDHVVGHFAKEATGASLNCDVDSLDSDHTLTCSLASHFVCNSGSWKRGLEEPGFDIFTDKFCHNQPDPSFWARLFSK